MSVSAKIQNMSSKLPQNITDWNRTKMSFHCIYSTGITSGRGYAHGEVGIAYIDIESVCIGSNWWLIFQHKFDSIFPLLSVVRPCRVMA